MLGAIRIRRIRLETRPDDPSGFAMCDRAFADEFQPGAQDEIATQLLPDKVELVAAKPHVCARAGESEFLLFRIVFGAARELWPADIAVALKWTKRRFLGRK